MCWITLEKGCDALAENCVVLRMGALATFLARMITLSGFLAAAERSAGASAAAWPGGCVPSAAPTPSCPPAAAPSASMAERLDFALCVVDKTSRSRSSVESVENAVDPEAVCVRHTERPHRSAG